MNDPYGQLGLPPVQAPRAVDESTQAAVDAYLAMSQQTPQASPQEVSQPPKEQQLTLGGIADAVGSMGAGLLGQAASGAAVFGQAVGQGLTAPQMAGEKDFPLWKPEVPTTEQSMTAGMGLTGIALRGLRADSEALKETEKTIKDFFGYDLSEGGEYALGQMGEAMQAIDEATGISKLFNAASDAITDFTLDTTNSPELAALGGTVPELAAELFGYDRLVALKNMSPRYIALRRMIEENVPHADVAAKTMDGRGFIVDRRSGINAMRQGFEKGDIASIVTGSSYDKQLFREMIDRYKQNRDMTELAALNPTSGIFGQRLQERVSDLFKLNKKFAADQNKLVMNLDKSLLDGDMVENAVQQFYVDLAQKFGVSKWKHDPKTGKYTLDFNDTDLEAFGASQKSIRAITSKLQRTDFSDPMQVHSAKRFIDNFIDYTGKDPAKLLDAQSKASIKQLRGQLDEILDNTYPEYKKINEQLSQSLGVIDAWKKYLPKGYEIDSSTTANALGVEFRKIGTNYKAGQLQPADIAQIEKFLKENGIVYPDNLFKQHTFIRMLYDKVGNEKKGSLQGIAQGMLTGNKAQVGAEIVRKALDTAMLRNPDKALKALEALVAE